jgi:protein arginine kinase
MSLPPISEQASDWMRLDGPQGQVVMSSRIRLARNVAGFPFVNRATPFQRRDIVDRCRNRILECQVPARMTWIDLTECSKLDRQVLVERRLISHQHSQATAARGVALAVDESVAIMVNEEDHLRIQVLRPGMQLAEAYQQADAIDDALESRLDFAYACRFGYLTACPTNVGTGIRVSVMLHLPGLTLTGEVDKLRRAAKDMHLAVRGFYGEGTEAIGDLFQISNQTTLGHSEQQILSDFQDVIIPQVIGYELKAREALAQKRLAVLDDRIYRAWGTLANARLLGSEETLYLLSHLRLGVCLGRINSVDLPVVHELLLLTQPAHLQKMAGRPLSGPERREFRAMYIRQRLGL